MMSAWSCKTPSLPTERRRPRPPTGRSPSRSSSEAPFTVTAPVPYAAERVVAEPVSADRRLRVPVRLREHLPDLVGRFGGMAVRAAPGLPQRVRRDPGPRRRPLPAGPVRRVGARGAPLPAGQPDPGDHLADPHRLADRARRAGDGPVARHRRAVADAPPHADGLGRRAHPAAHRALCQRHRRVGDELRAGVRLPPHQRHVGVLGPGLRRGDRAGQQATPTRIRRCG